jgi:shikimate dehydrogenase
MDFEVFSTAEIYRLNQGCDFYGVVGYPVKHTLSPVMQQAALDALGVNAKYLAFEVSPHELAELLPVFAKKGAKGLNLTVPHKEVVISQVAELSDTARQAGAANTLSFLGDGRIVGHNTDALGFSRAIREEFMLDLRGLRVLILGAGGAARAVALQCVLEDADEVVIANRTLEKARKIAEQVKKFRRTEKLIGPQEPLRAVPLDVELLRGVLDHIDLVVNCTSLGLAPGDASPLPQRCFQPHHLVYDTIYRPLRTPLMLEASRAGARVANGLSMLLHQGALSLEIWLGREAPLAVMRLALMKAAGT